MTVPVYLDSSYSYIEVPSVADVADIITEFRDQVLNHNSPAWTEPSSGLFKSPPDGSSRWIDVLLTKIAANNLECRVRDANGNTVLTGRMQIGSAATVRIYTGQFHFHIEMVGGSPEYVRGGIIDLTPESQSIHTQWAYAYTYRDTSDTVRTAVTWGELAMYDNNAYAIYKRVLPFACGGIGKSNQTASSAWQFGACGVACKAPGEGTNYSYAGRVYQHLICPDDVFGSEFVVPVDASTYGTFKVLAPAANYYQKVALRIA